MRLKSHSNDGGIAASIGVLLIVALWVTCIVGWIMNIVKLVGMIGGVAGMEFILRIVGIPVGPLGVVMGLFV